MLLRTVVLTLAALSVSGGAMLVHAAEPVCTELDGWTTGRDGKAADAACTSESYGEAYRLGDALADLRERHAALEARIKPDADDVGLLRRQQRQLDVDIEAIRGVAMLRGWPDDVSERSTEGEKP